MTTFWVGTAVAVVGAASAAKSNSDANKRARAANGQAQTAADQQAQAAEDVKFRPYAVTNSFGRANFINGQQAKANLAKLEELNTARQAANAANPRTAPSGASAGGFAALGGMAVAGGGTPLKELLRNEIQGATRVNEAGQTVNNSNEGKQGFYSGDDFFTTQESASFDLNQNVKDSIQSNQDSAKLSFDQATERAKQTPEALAKDRYQRYLDFVRPQQQSDFDKLLGGLAGAGQLGYRNTATGTNPIIESFSRGLANSDRQNYNQAITDEQLLTDSLFTRGRQGFSTANGLDGLGTQAISLGAELGGRSSTAGIGAAGQLNQATATSLAGQQLQRNAADQSQANNLGLARSLLNSKDSAGNSNVQNAVNGVQSWWNSTPATAPQSAPGFGPTFDPNTGSTLF